MYVQVSNFLFSYPIEYQTHVRDSKRFIFPSISQKESCNAGVADDVNQWTLKSAN